MNCGIVVCSGKKLRFGKPIYWERLKDYPNQVLLFDIHNAPNFQQSLTDCLPFSENLSLSSLFKISLKTAKKMLLDFETFYTDWEDGNWQYYKKELRQGLRNFQKAVFWKTCFPHDYALFFFKG